MSNKNKFKKIIENDFNKEKNYESIINKIENDNPIRLKKIIMPICICIFMFSFTIILFNNNSKKTKVNNNIKNMEDTEDKIIFNNQTIDYNELADIDGKAIEFDIDKYIFLNNIIIPENYEFKRAYEVYVKDSIDNYLNYTKLWQCHIIYTLDEGEAIPPKLINILFTKEKRFLTDLNEPETNYDKSIINNIEIGLFRSGNYKQAIFEYNNYNFFVNAYDLKDEDFIILIKSIIK